MVCYHKITFMEESLASQIQSLITGKVISDTTTLDTYSKDASIFSVTPKLVVEPQNPKDISALVKFATSHPELNLSLTARSAGTCMAGGAINDSIILDMTKHFSKIIKIGEESATTEPGVYYRDFEKATLKRDLLLPCYTASREINTVGGMVGNNSAGEKSLQYGQTKDYVQGLKVILSDGQAYEFKPIDKTGLDKKLRLKSFEGNLYRKTYKLLSENFDDIQKAKPNVSKNSAGYLLWDAWDKTTFDLTKILTGSQGTLGIITEITFKLIRPQKHSSLLVVYLYKLSNLANIVNDVLSHKPESFESFDDQTIKVASKFLPDVASVLKQKTLLSTIFKFIPETLLALTHGFPKLVLLAEFSAQTQDEANDKMKQCQDSLQKYHLPMHSTQTEEEAEKYWTIRRESFNLLRKHSEHMRTAPFIDDFIIKPEKFAEFLPSLQKILRRYKKDLIYTIAGHIGNGNFHIIPLMDFTKPNTPQIIEEISNKVYKLVLEYNGSISAEHNDGIVRGPFLKQMYGEKIFNLFKDVKHIFDPQNIFNPHKKVDATWQFYKDHLATPHHSIIHGS